ncbi:MAG: hypothetical protein ACRD0A_06115 [Acidimicrobiales bacterium]
MAWAEASRQATNCASELHRLLERHLTFEDEFVLPLFTRHFSADEYHALDVRAAGFVALGQRRFSISWAMANAEPTEQASLLNRAPLALKILWYATRSRYRRLTAAAFGANATSVGR